MEPMRTKRRRDTGSSPPEPKDSSIGSSAPSAEFPESEKRMICRGSDDDALQRIEELPTEPHHALPAYPDVDWDAPTIPDGKTLDAWDTDERGS